MFALYSNTPPPSGHLIWLKTLNDLRRYNDFSQRLFFRVDTFPMPPVCNVSLCHHSLFEGLTLISILATASSTVYPLSNQVFFLHAVTLQTVVILFPLSNPQSALTLQSSPSNPGSSTSGTPYPWPLSLQYPSNHLNLN